MTLVHHDLQYSSTRCLSFAYSLDCYLKRQALIQCTLVVSKCIYNCILLAESISIPNTALITYCKLDTQT
jgi:hypothetical protein